MTGFVFCLIKKQCYVLFTATDLTLARITQQLGVQKLENYVQIRDTTKKRKCKRSFF